MRIGSEPGGSDICSPIALASGYRLIPKFGNAGSDTHWFLNGAGLIAGETYYWSVQTLDTAFSGSAFAVEDSVQYAFSDVSDPEFLPTRFALHPNRPNPGRPSTVIVFDLPEPSAVRLLVFDVLGRQVASLAEGPHPAGRHAVAWNGQATGGIPVQTGVYFYRLEVESFAQTRKMMITR